MWRQVWSKKLQNHEDFRRRNIATNEKEISWDGTFKMVIRPEICALNLTNKPTFFVQKIEHIYRFAKSLYETPYREHILLSSTLKANERKSAPLIFSVNFLRDCCFAFKFYYKLLRNSIEKKRNERKKILTKTKLQKILKAREKNEKKHIKSERNKNGEKNVERFPILVFLPSFYSKCSIYF